VCYYKGAGCITQSLLQNLGGRHRRPHDCCTLLAPPFQPIWRCKLPLAVNALEENTRPSCSCCTSHDRRALTAAGEDEEDVQSAQHVTCALADPDGSVQRD